MRTGEKHELIENTHYIQEVMLILLNNKFKKRGKISDIEFIKNCELPPMVPTIEINDTIDLTMLSCNELREICRNKNIKGCSALTKEALIHKITMNEDTVETVDKPVDKPVNTVKPVNSIEKYFKH